MKKRKTLADQIRARVQASPDLAFILRDFADLVERYDYDQVLRALRQLVKEQVLAKIGRGIYAKMFAYSDGEVLLAAPLGKIAREALEKLGIRTFDCLYLQAYNLGLSTQIPTGRVIGVQQRVRRKITYQGSETTYETIPRDPRKLREAVYRLRND